MKDSQYHLNANLRFDLFQQMVLWLSSTMYAPRKGRRYLERNLTLLEIEVDRELEKLIAAHMHDTFEVKQQMQTYQALLRDIHQRGGTLNAIREAYVNAYGGFALDLPQWLEKVEEKQALLRRLNRPERTTRAQVALLREAFMRALQDGSVARECIAEIQNVLGNTLVQNSHSYSYAAHLQALEQGMACHESALSVYTFERYPLQHAKTRMFLGLAYQQYGKTGQDSDLWDAIEQAIRSYEAALRIYTFDDFPEQWALLQTHLGSAYLERNQGDPQENQEYALACHKAALQIAEQLVLASVLTTIQINLADTYRLRMAGSRADNLKQAMHYYRAVLRTITPHTHPSLWAAIHIKLATLFEEEVASLIEDNAQHDLKLRCAIVCCEGALGVYTLDAYPVEYAATLVMLGRLHSERRGGDLLHNIEQAIKCYRDALRVFSSQAFPTEYRQVLRCFAQAEEQRKLHADEAQTFTPSPTRV